MKQYLSFSPDEWNHVAVFAMRHSKNPCAGCPDQISCCGCAEGDKYHREYGALTEDEKQLLVDYHHVQYAQEEVDKAMIALQLALKTVKEKYGSQAINFNGCCRTFFISNYGDIKKAK